EPWTQHRYANPSGREFTPQPLGQRDNAILGDVVCIALPRNKASDRGRGDDVSTLAMLLDQRPENFDPPDGRHKVDAQSPVPRRLGPGAISPTAADARVVDEDMHLAIAGGRGFGGRHEFGFE